MKKVFQNPNDPLLTREEFKRQVFAKTNGKCCVPGCTCDAVDAHHIMDRKLWSDGGYYITNGAALCEKHHWDAENGTITPKQCLDYMDIDWREIRMPQKLRDIYKNDNYYSVITAFYRSWIYKDSLDKWGN